MGAPNDNPGDFIALSGYVIAQGIAQAIKRCGDDLTRENLLKQSTSMKGQRFKMMLPGIALSTTPENHTPYQSLRIAKFEGMSWKLLNERECPQARSKPVTGMAGRAIVSVRTTRFRNR